MPEVDGVTGNKVAARLFRACLLLYLSCPQVNSYADRMHP